MSKSRLRAGAGKSKKLPKGPNGRNLCRYCQREVEPPRRTFCGDDCVHEWRLRTSPSYVRECVFQRDHGLCARCGCDTQQLEKELKKHWRGSWAQWGQLWDDLKAQGFDRGKTLWHADHIVPVAEGGGECGLDNYRTLCVPCHKEETRELRRRLRENGVEAGL